MEDPVERAEQDSITPDFDANSNGNTQEANTQSQAANTLKNAEKSAAGKTGGKDAKQEEKSPASAANKLGGGLSGGFGGLFTGKGKNGKGGASPSGMLNGLASGGNIVPVIIILIVILILIIVMFLASPIFMISTIDYNLQSSLGFSDTTAVIEEQGLNIVEELAKKGELPDGFAGDLADAGILVGQVSSSGDFVRTNRYIANLDGNQEIAASGFDYYATGAEGELAFLFNNQVVNADSFVAIVNSNPEMYAAYSKALDVTARFYYSNDVNDVYNELGLSRGTFNGWVGTGNNETDMENFYEILEDILQSDISASMAGCEEEGNCDEAELSTGGDPSTIIANVSATSGGTDQAAQLLNSAISASEPRQAARAFLAIEEPLQRARIDGDGPVNQVMTALSTPTKITYTDVNTGEEVTAEKSIISTSNFAAAVSNGKYSTSEANNFSRDRVLVATEKMNNSTIGETTVNDDKSSPSTVLKRGNEAVNSEIINKSTSSVTIATAEFDKKIFSSIVGGNRIVEGGSYLSNTINMRTLGAMPSDAETIAKYQREVDVMVARKAEVERTTLSPFDVSTPNTFLGSIVHGFAKIMINHSSGSNSLNVVSAISATTDLAGASINSLFDSTIAEGDDQKFTTLAGDCATVTTANNAEGDIYCNSHNTITTKYMKRTKEEWINALSGSLDSEGKVNENGELSNFIKLGMDREATVGVQSAAVCEAYKKDNPDLISELSDAVSKLFKVYDACKRVDPQISTGSQYTLSSSNSNNINVEQYSGYALYDTVYGLIKDSQSSISAFKESYYKIHPKDTSAAGQIARFSGMTKDEAELALSYASYLTIIANYHPADRLQFGGPIFDLNEKVSFVHDEKTKENLYCFWCGRFERSEERNRSFAA